MNYAENALISKMSRVKRQRRLSVVEIAKNVLERNFHVAKDGRYFLWQFGRWCPVNLDEVMRAANRKLHSERRPQISVNPSWVVQ